jgi:ABC-type sugar transport system permease subunit
MRASSKAPITKNQRWWGLFFVSPAALFFAVFAIFPILFGSYLSLTRYNLLSPPVYVGFSNYVALFHDRMFLLSLRNTVVFVLGATIPVWIGSLLLALVFDSKVPGRTVWRALFFLPVLPPLVVVAVIWKVILHPNGMVTAILAPFTGLGEIPWLTDPTLSPILIVLVNNWTMIPFFAMIWLAGLASIPDELRHASRLDGASRTQTFFFVVLPMLKRTGVLVAALSTINAFQAFILQYEMTPDKGGPADANLTLGLLIWKYGFQYFRMGDAAAASVVLFAIILIVTLVQLFLGRSKH